MAKIDISKIRDIYPNYKEGGLVTPAVLVESMIILQNQESNLSELLSDSLKEVDSLKFELDKKNKAKEAFLEKVCVQLISEDKIPKEFRKNQDLTDYYIKHGSDSASEYETMVEACLKAEEKLIAAKSVHKKYDSLASVVHNAINTSIQLLSYLKHEEKMSNVSTF